MDGCEVPDSIQQILNYHKELLGCECSSPYPIGTCTYCDMVELETYIKELLDQIKETKDES